MAGRKSICGGGKRLKDKLRKREKHRKEKEALQKLNKPTGVDPVPSSSAAPTGSSAKLRAQVSPVATVGATSPHKGSLSVQKNLIPSGDNNMKGNPSAKQAEASSSSQGTSGTRQSRKRKRPAALNESVLDDPVKNNINVGRSRPNKNSAKGLARVTPELGAGEAPVPSDEDYSPSSATESDSASQCSMAPSPLSVTTTRNNMTIETEQLRRIRIKESYEQLRLLLPHYTGFKLDVASVLEICVNYVEILMKWLPTEFINECRNELMQSERMQVHRKEPRAVFHMLKEKRKLEMEPANKDSVLRLGTETTVSSMSSEHFGHMPQTMQEQNMKYYSSIPGSSLATPTAGVGVDNIAYSEARGRGVLEITGATIPSSVFDLFKSMKNQLHELQERITLLENKARINS